eukprot:gene5577-6140_t
MKPSNRLLSTSKNWLLEKLTAEKIIQEGDEIDSDVLDESENEEEEEEQEEARGGIISSQWLQESAPSTALHPPLAQQQQQLLSHPHLPLLQHYQTEDGRLHSMEFYDHTIPVSVPNLAPTPATATTTTCYEEDDDELENYRKFLQSIWDEDEEEGEEDDEDYVPEPVEEDAQPVGTEEDDDDPTIEEEAVKVNKKELRDLVSECWLTIAGQPLDCNGGGGSVSGSGSDANPSVTTATNTTSAVMNMETLQSMYDQQISAMAMGSAQRPCGRGDGFNFSNSVNGSIPCAPPAANTTSSATPETLFPSQIGEGIHQSNSTTAISQTVLSTLVTQLFTGNKLSDLSIDGMPVGAIRKIVARQLAMALQLLLQILLQADDRSNCFASGYNCLVQLSNFREIAVRKAVLMQQNVKNVTALKHVKTDHSRNRLLEVHEMHRLMQQGGELSTVYSENPIGNDGPSHPHHPNNEQNTVLSSDTTPQRLTRSHVLRYNTQSQRSSSLFDVPMLSRISEVFSLTDRAKNIIKQQLQSSNTMTTLPSSCALLLSDGSANNQSITMTRSTILMKACSDQMEKLYHSFGMRLWKCLLPTPTYPIQDFSQMSLDPLSIVGRSYFTPTEDDLLLRGLVTLGEDRWNDLKVLFLPSKDVPILQFRYTQKTLITMNIEQNGFKRFQQIIAEGKGSLRSKDEAWSLIDDFFLLKGFQVFGHKWHLYSLFFLPHRKAEEMKYRWGQLQKTWLRAFPQNSLHGQAITIGPDLATFLDQLQCCHTVQEVMDLVKGREQQPSSSTTTTNGAMMMTNKSKRLLSSSSSMENRVDEMEVVQEAFRELSDSESRSSTPSIHQQQVRNTTSSSSSSSSEMLQKDKQDAYRSFLQTRLVSQDSSIGEGDTNRLPLPVPGGGISSSSSGRSVLPSSSAAAMLPPYGTHKPGGQNAYIGRQDHTNMMLPSLRSEAWYSRVSNNLSSNIHDLPLNSSLNNPIHDNGMMNHDDSVFSDVTSKRTEPFLGADLLCSMLSKTVNDESAVSSGNIMNSTSVEHASSSLKKRISLQQPQPSLAKKSRPDHVSPPNSSDNISSLPVSSTSIYQAVPCAIPVEQSVERLALTNDMRMDNQFLSSDISLGFTNLSRMISLLKEDSNHQPAIRDCPFEQSNASDAAGSIASYGSDSNGLFASVMRSSSISGKQPNDKL